MSAKLIDVTALIAKQLAKFGVLNIGAVGTFVVREDVRESALRARSQEAAIKCEIMICPARDVINLHSRGFILTTTLGPKIIGRERVSQTTRTLPPLLSLCLDNDWLGENHCDPRQIRPGSVPSQDEGDHLPWQDREAVGVPVTTRNWNTIEKVRENSLSD